MVTFPENGRIVVNELAGLRLHPALQFAATSLVITADAVFASHNLHRRLERCCRTLKPTAKNDGEENVAGHEGMIAI